MSTMRNLPPEDVAVAEIDRIIRETAMEPIFYGESFPQLCAAAIFKWMQALDADDWITIPAEVDTSKPPFDGKTVIVGHPDFGVRSAYFEIRPRAGARWVHAGLGWIGFAPTIWQAFPALPSPPKG